MEVRTKLYFHSDHQLAVYSEYFIIFKYYFYICKNDRSDLFKSPWMFLVNGQTENILGFMSRVVSVTTQNSVSTKTARDDT